MINGRVTLADSRRHFYPGRLPLFDHIAQGFLEAVAGRQKSGLFAVLNYLDGAVMIDGASRARRTVVLAMEDLEQHIEAPLTLQSEAHAQMSLLKLNPIPEFKFYGDIATAILRMDSALRTRARMISIEETMGALELWHTRQRAIIELKPADVIPFKASA
jgi:hypothetical protein